MPGRCPLCKGRAGLATPPPRSIGEAGTRTGNGKPVVIIMKTAMGYGVDFMAGTHKWHGVAPNDDELARALAQCPETLGDY